MVEGTETGETSLDLQVRKATNTSNEDKTGIVPVNGKISITGVTPTIQTVALKGTDGNDLTDNKVTVNATDNVSLTAAATSAKGTVITDKVTWSVSPANQGVTINATTGAITVGAKATAGEYTVTAGAKGNATTGSATQKFTVEHAASVATTIDIYKDGVKLTPAANGSITDTAVIPVAGAANNECTYTAKVLDQFGDVMKNADQTDVTAQITVGTLPTGEGTSFTPADGKLTVAAGTATSDGVKFTATYSGKTQEFTVKFVAIEVQNWPGKTLEEGEAKSFVYGTSNGSIIGSFTAAGKALVGSDELAGTFAVTDADKYLPVGTGKTVAVTFTVDATKHPAYPNTTITKTYTVTITKKPITVNVTPKEISYGDDLPTKYAFALASGSTLVGSDNAATVLNGLGAKLVAVNAQGAKLTDTPDAGSYKVAMDTPAFEADNYAVTVAENNDGLTINKAAITGFTGLPTPAAVYANNEKNATTANSTPADTLAGLKELAGVSTLAQVTAEYGNVTPKKTATLNITEWTADKAHAVKGATYKFTGTVNLADEAGKNFTLAADKAPVVELSVKSVIAAATLTETSGTKASAAVKGADVTAENWTSELGLPTEASVTYKGAAGDDGTPTVGEDLKTRSITGWTPGFDAVKAQAPAEGQADVKVNLAAAVEYPEWATPGADPTYVLTLTPKYPVTLTLTTSPSTITFGGTLTAPAAKQSPVTGETEDNSGNASFTYHYDGADGTTYSSETPPTNAGKYTVTATLVSETHSGHVTSAVFEIQPKEITADMITVAGDPLTYNKRPQTPKVTVADGGTSLVEDTDYTVAYTNNTNAGSGATVTVTGIGNYKGTPTKTFTISPASLTAADVNAGVVIDGAPEAGNVLTAKVSGVTADDVTYSWTVGGTANASTTNTYTVKTADSKASITVTITGKGNYAGSVTSTAVEVEPVSISGTVTISTANLVGGVIGTDTILTAVVAGVEPVEAQSGLTVAWYSGEDLLTAEADGTYKVKADDTGKNIFARVTAGGNFEGSLDSADVKAGAKPLDGTVSISGTPNVGEKLTASVTGSSAGENDYTITWLCDGVEIGTSAEYTVDKADQGKTLTVKVTAKEDSAFTGELTATQAIPAKAPEKPTVTATPGDGEVTVSWSAPATNGSPITGYSVSISPVPTGAASPVSVTLSDPTSYTFTGLTNDTEYTFSVTATSAAGNAVSDDVKATPTGYVPPEPEEPDVPVLPPVIFDPGTGSGGGTGGSGSGSGSGTTQPDTDVTENPDGSTVTVETQPDGTVVTTTVESDGSTAVKMENPDGSSTTTIQKADGSEAIVNTDASGKTSAVVDLSNEAISSAQNTGAAVALPIENVTATRDTETAPTVVVNTESEQPVKVEIPVSNANPGTVAVLVKADGTEEIIKTTVPTADGIAVKLNSGDAVKVVDNSKFFSDTATHWGGDAVDFVSARELFGGTGENKFSPDDAMTRGMLMTVLARYENVDTTGGATWYEKGVAWAVAQGLSDGTNPNGRITREQLATIIYRYAQSKGVDTTASGNLERFPDAGKVSDWAREAMSWAVGEGIISGVGGVTLDPSGNATRAQVATIIMRYAEKFAE